MKEILYLFIKIQSLEKTWKLKKEIKLKDKIDSKFIIYEDSDKELKSSDFINGIIEVELEELNIWYTGIWW